MARHLSQTLTKLSSTTTTSLKPLNFLRNSLSSCFLSHGNLSSKAQFIEVDLDSFSSGDGAGAGAGVETELIGLKRLEDAIHGIIVKRLAPDWLPFRPGSSYWVPPKRRADSILEVVGKLTNPLSEEESLSFASDCGWPSSSFFLEGSGSVSEYYIHEEVNLEPHMPSKLEKASLSEDED